MAKQASKKSFPRKALDFFFGFEDVRVTANGTASLSPQDFVNANVFPFLGNGQQITPEDNFNYIKRGYMESPSVYECIDLIMKKILACPVLIYRVKNVQAAKEYENLLKSDNIADRARAFLMKERVYEEVEDSRLRKLLEQPNDTQTWDEFISLITVLYLATGNAFVYGNAADGRSKKITEAWALPFSPLEMNIQSGGMFDPVKGYVAIYNGGKSTLEFSANDIEHIKTVNPLYRTTGQQLYGLSPLKAYEYALLREKYGDKAALKVLESGAPFGFLTPKDPIDELTTAQKQAWTEKIRDVINGRRPEGRYIPGSIPMDWVPIGFPNSELQTLDNSKDVRESIYRGYHIPLVYASNDASTYNNSREAKRALIFDAVLPVATAIFNQLSAFFTRGYEGYVIKPDIMSLPEMATDMKELMDWLDKAPVSTDEARAALGYSELRTSDSGTILVNRNKVPLNVVASGGTAGTGTIRVE
jgi:HK97 family phage portal protein